MKKAIYIICLFALTFNTKDTKAQLNDSYFNFYYSMGLGTGELNDFISKYSWRGVGMEYKTEVTDNILAGFGVDWNVFYEDMPYGTFTQDNVSVSGKQFRYLNTYPMTAKLHYYRDSDNGVRFIAGTGIGTSYMERDIDMGQYSINNNTWQFLVVPEIAATYDIDASRSLLLSLKYNYNFKNDQLPSMSYLSFNIGFAFNQ
jgi:outer membrane protein